ncbi:glycolate oxidase subunit GlcF [Stakelama saccharophila]|uniref:Glycolate oxidase iron-sulfur subunit n=1 Tax=Stakelama saccharophila TaxID=3075605 RepID=A0ABZ0B9I4_9SPHN|nr:glycolate oxidase subunit GlcF [Stakelama sp. W311]WNO54082.1 glycolate oxidase subunit GlcF [Stakelama sp. W311]
MQTRFSPEQLADPTTHESETVIRRCVHCGFCTATCPTYVLLGDELDSPRGRITLMKEMLERGETPTREVVTHVDRCLSCLACETTCPSGVSYRRLVDHARSYIEATYRRPLGDRMLRGMLAAILPYRRRFATAARLGRMVRPLAPVMERWEALRPLAAMLRLSRRPPPVPAYRACRTAPVRRRVAMLEGCVEPVMGAHVQATARRLLERMGCEIVTVSGAGCCGAMPQHLGQGERAEDFARANVDAWSRAIAAGVDTIVVTASGCGSVLKDYGHLLRSDARYVEAAQRISARVRDVTELVAELGLPDGVLGDDAPVVAYHPACSLQHGQRVRDMPKALLEHAGFVVMLPWEAHLCCGSAGTYNILQPAIASQLGARKAAALDTGRPRAIATGNIGCMAQIAQYTDTPLVHTVELLDWATGGPMPPALVQARKA